MTAHLEVWGPAGPHLVVLEGDRASIGRSDANEVTLAGDTAVSRLHAVLERLPAGWCLRDLGSRNGVLVNGARIAAPRVMQSGDEVRIGGTRLIFRSTISDGDSTVGLTVAEAPELTRREREVLVLLCRPLLAGSGIFTEPATVKEIAEQLFVTEAAVKQHITNLYDKFSLVTPEQRRRLTLANEAVQRGAVTVEHLRQADSRRGGG